MDSQQRTTSAATENAWRSYLEAIDEARTFALNSRWAQTPKARAQALYYIAMMQAFGFNTYMGPRQAYPAFLSPILYAGGVRMGCAKSGFSLPLDRHRRHSQLSHLGQTGQHSLAAYSSPTGLVGRCRSMQYRQLGRR